MPAAPSQHIPDTLSLFVMADPADPALLAQARVWADRLSLPMAAPADPALDADALLVQTADRLELRVIRGDRALVGGRALACELTAIDTTSGPGRSLRQPLVKAVGIKRRDRYRPTVFDATAGLGEDAWILAAVGCTVRAFERSAVTWALLADGLRRAAEADPQTAARLSIEHLDARSALAGPNPVDPSARPDVVYLDPMFPLGRKTAERKAMRTLRLISGDDMDAGELLSIALQAASRRVVVKRPIRADPLPGPTPAVCHKAKSLRFDVYPVSK